MCLCVLIILIMIIMMFIIMAGYSHCAGFAFLRHFCQFAVNSRHLQGTAKVAGESGGRGEAGGCC